MTRDEILEALKPFADAAEGLDDDEGRDLWEAPCTTILSAADLIRARRVYDAISARPAGEPSKEAIQPDFVTSRMIDAWRLGARKAGAEHDARFSELTDCEIANGLRDAIRIYDKRARAAGFKAAKERAVGTARAWAKMFQPTDGYELSSYQHGQHFAARSIEEAIRAMEDD